MSKIMTEMEEILVLKATIQDLEKRISTLENSGAGTGVYLDGSPNYVKEYIAKSSKNDIEKVGE